MQEDGGMLGLVWQKLLPNLITKTNFINIKKLQTKYYLKLLQPMKTKIID